jgi:hypothetical protein
MKFSQVFLDQAASEVADRFMKKGEAPTDVVLDIALRNSLNVEQIRRVCEAGNIAIKIASTDPNIVFPLAKYEEVLDTMQPSVEGPSTGEVAEVSKTASFDQEDLPPLLDEDEMSKIAEYKTARNRNYAAANMYFGLENAIQATRREMAEIAESVEKQAAFIIESAVSEMVKLGNANQSYSILANLCHNEVEQALLGQLYKIACRQFERDYGREVPVVETVKIAGIPNPSSPLFEAVSGYLDNMGKYAMKRESLATYQDHKERFRAQLYGPQEQVDDAN